MDKPAATFWRFAKYLGFAFAALALLGYILLHYQPARKQGAKIATLLAGAQNVTVLEYRDVSMNRFYEDLLTETKLTPDQAQELGRIFEDNPLFYDTGKTCLFEPHHQIRFTAASGSEHVIHVCFQCWDIALDDGRAFDMSSWEPKLRAAFGKVGVPIRQDIYRFDPAK